MAVIDFELFKKHVRADDFADDDDYLRHLLSTAEAQVIANTNRSEQELTELGGGEFPKPLLHAILMLGAHWYNQREAVATVQMSEIPYTMQALIKPYRKLAKQ